MKAFAGPVSGVNEIQGLKLELRIPHKSFLDQRSRAEEDQLALYATTDAIARFADNAITSQALVDESVVLINGNRTNVPLTE